MITLRHLELQVGGMRKEHGATGTERWMSTRAFANHFFSRLRFVGLRSPNKNKYHSTVDITSMILTTLVI